MSTSGVRPADSTLLQAEAGRAPVRDPPAALAQARLSSAAIPCGVPAIGAVHVTVFVRGSMREIVPWRKFAVQSDPFAKTMNITPRPTEIVRVVGFGPGSIRHTVPSCGFAVQIDPPPTAMPANPCAGTEIV